MYSASSWLILILLVKLGSEELVGIYALGVAICAPVGVLTGLGLTGGLVTDVARRCPYGRYLTLRLFTATASILLVAAIVLTLDYAWNERLVVLLVAVSTAIAAVRELLLAVMKRSECMDLVGISQIVVACGVLGAFSLTFWFTHSLPWSVVAICVARAVVTLAHDLPHARGLARAFDNSEVRLDWSPRELFVLGATSAPLAAAMALGALALNIPRYLLEGYHGAEVLGYFAAMAAIVAAGERLMNTLGTAVTPRLARYFVENRRAYVRMTLRLLLIALTVGLASILTAWAFGRPILTFLFTSDFARLNWEFLLLMVNLAIMLLVSFTNQALVASRAFAHLSLSNAAVCLISLFFSWWLVRSSGLRGACWALIVTSICQLVILGSFYIIRVRCARVLASTSAEPGSGAKS